MKPGYHLIRWRVDETGRFRRALRVTADFYLYSPLPTAVRDVVPRGDLLGLVREVHAVLQRGGLSRRLAGQLRGLKVACGYFFGCFGFGFLERDGARGGGARFSNCRAACCLALVRVRAWLRRRGWTRHEVTNTFPQLE